MAEFKVRIAVIREYSHTIKNVETIEQAREVAMRTPVETIMRMWEPRTNGMIQGVLTLKESADTVR